MKSFKPKEKHILRFIKQHLQYMENLGKLFYIRINSGTIFIRGKKRYRKIEMAKIGTPDLVVFFNNGKVIFIETKSRYGKQTKKQKEFEEKIKKIGYTYFLCNDTDKYLKFMEEYL